MNLGLQGRIAVVTGGESGIGRASVDVLSEEGARVVSADLQIRDHETRAGMRVETDVTDRNSVRDLFRKVESSLGTPDVVVANAGVFAAEPFDQIEVSDWDRLLDVNLRGVFLTVQAALSHMSSGSLVTVASMAGQSGGLYAGVDYAASKGGVIALTRAFAKQLAGRPIRINCVSPGVIDTPMTQAFPQDVRSGVAESHPLGRWGTPREVAEVIAFVVSSRASFVNGARIDVNGGSLMQ